MADRDPNAIVSEGWIDKKGDFEGLKIPDGVDKTKLGTEFYAYQRTYKSGRRVIEWYKRNSGGGTDGQGDAVLTTSEDTVQAIKDKWDEDEAKPPATRTINGVPHQVVGKDANGQEIWAPVQTTTGTATATTTPRTPDQIAQTQAQTAQTQAQTAATAKEEAEKDANAAAGRGRLTDAQWTTELARREAAAKAAGNQAEANRLAQERLNFDKEKEARPEIKVESVDLPNGRKGTRVTSVPKDGSAVTIKNFDENGKPLETMPVPRTAEPPGAPKPGYRLGQITQGLSDYSAWLNEQVRLWQSSGGKEGMSPDAATKAMEQRRAEATSAISEQTGIANAQGTLRGQDITQRGQDLSETQSRRGAGRDIYTTTLTQFLPLLKLMGGPNGGQLLSDAINNTLRGGLEYNRAWGGDRESPQVATPAFLQSIMQTPPPGQAMGAAPTFGFRATDGAAVPGVMPAPDPAGAEAIRQQAMATAAATSANAGRLAAPPAEPPPAPAVNPISAQPITVPTRPLPTPEPPLIEPPSRGNIPSAAPGSESAPPMKQDVLPALPAVPSEQIPVGPMPYGQTVLPVMPSLEDRSGIPLEVRPTQLPHPGMDPSGIPGPVSPLLPGEVTMTPSFLQTARYGQAFDPRGMALRRIAAGANPEIVSSAFEEMYGVPLQGVG